MLLEVLHADGTLIDEKYNAILKLTKSDQEEKISPTESSQQISKQAPPTKITTKGK